LIMPLRTWDHFGGLDGQQQGYRPAENDIKQWAQAFGPVQAQALLCNGDVYLPSYGETLTISKELMATAVQRYNRQKKGMPAGLLEQIIPKVNQLKFTLNPMHLLVQKAYFAYKVTCHSRAQISAASPHDHRLKIFAAIVEAEL
jgi:hypothetical protein